ncbi:MAG: SPOR domain-containing protein, partial [Marinobacter sp.]
MAQDYARKKRSVTPSTTSKRKPSKAARAPKKRTKPAAPARSQRGGLSFKWILSLATVGGFIGFIVYLNSVPPSAGPQPVVDKTTRQPAAAITKPQEKKQAFRFYDMLPESEVIPPKVDEYTPGPAKQTYDYIVQSGSFRTKQDAERQRAQIAFMGLRASVQNIELDSGSVWYRVNVGPFTSRSQMSSAVDKLVSINIQPLARKIPK